MPATPPDAASKPPFFIIGCVRSGTTMLRNILRMHPQLACPEETHFYRWSEPFRGPGYRNVTVNNMTLKRHRHIDGITEEEFLAMLEASTSRADLCRRYMARFVALKKPGASRWFDKSPQNAYGAAMIATEFPNAKFIHIVRNPVNVVASLRIGKVMKMDDLVGACSYWNEAVANLTALHRAWRHRVLEIKYETFAAKPVEGIQEILAFLGEAYDPADFADVVTAEVRHEDSGVLSEDELQQVRQLCLAGRVRYGYSSPTSLVDKEALKSLGREERQQLKRTMRNAAGKKPGGPGMSGPAHQGRPARKGLQRKTEPVA